MSDIHYLLPDLDETLTFDPVVNKFGYTERFAEQGLIDSRKALDAMQPGKQRDEIEADMVQLQRDLSEVRTEMTKYEPGPDAPSITIRYIPQGQLTKLQQQMADAGKDNLKMIDAHRAICAAGIIKAEFTTAKGHRRVFEPNGLLCDTLQRMKWLASVSLRILNFNTLDDDTKKK